MTRRYSVYAKCMLYALCLLLTLSACRVNCCADVTTQLTAITNCDKDFTIVDNYGCGPCTDYQIAERLGPEQLDCGPYFTEVVGNVTFVTMGEATP